MKLKKLVYCLCITLAAWFIFSAAGCACAIPNGTQRTEKKVATGVGGLTIIEQRATKTVFMPFTAEGPQWHYPRSTIWSYWFSDEKGIRSDIKFLKTESDYFGVMLNQIEEENRWLAVDVSSDEITHLILFSEKGIQDERNIHLDRSRGSPWAFQFSDRNRKFTYMDGGSPKELFITTDKLNDKNPNN